MCGQTWKIRRYVHSHRQTGRVWQAHSDHLQVPGRKVHRKSTR